MREGGVGAGMSVKDLASVSRSRTLEGHQKDDDGALGLYLKHFGHLELNDQRFRSSQRQSR